MIININYVVSFGVNLSSILGSCALVLGLYFVLWGKSREQMPIASVDLEKASCLSETNK
jgi:hypothetical protein